MKLTQLYYYRAAQSASVVNMSRSVCVCVCVCFYVLARATVGTLLYVSLC